jgi:hypothetical protein
MQRIATKVLQFYNISKMALLTVLKFSKKVAFLLFKVKKLFKYVMQ